jgi:sulfur carrier protein
MLEILLNGEATRVLPQQTLGQLVAGLALPAQAMAVAVNRNVVPRHRWPDFAIVQGDQVDIVRAIGGG